MKKPIKREPQIPTYTSADKQAIKEILSKPTELSPHFLRADIRRKQMLEK